MTHGLTYIPYMDAIIVVKDGEIVERGNYDSLMAHQGVLTKLIKNYHNEASDSDNDDIDNEQM